MYYHTASLEQKNSSDKVLSLCNQTVHFIIFQYGHCQPLCKPMIQVRSCREYSLAGVCLDGLVFA